MALYDLMTIPEIAHLLGVSEKTAANRVSEAGIPRVSGYRTEQVRALHRPGRGFRSDLHPTRMAYDFGDAVHVMDLDGQGAWIPGTDEVLPLVEDRDTTLTEAGYELCGFWSLHGEAEGVRVRRTTTAGPAAAAAERGGP